MNFSKYIQIYINIHTSIQYFYIYIYTYVIQWGVCIHVSTNIIVCNWNLNEIPTEHMMECVPISLLNASITLLIPLSIFACSAEFLWSQLSFYNTSFELQLLCCLIFPLTCNYKYSIFLRSSNWLVFLFVPYSWVESSFSLCYIIFYLSQYFTSLFGILYKSNMYLLFLIDKYSMTWHIEGASDSLSISLSWFCVFLGFLFGNLWVLCWPFAPPENITFAFTKHLDEIRRRTNQGKFSLSWLR